MKIYGLIGYPLAHSFSERYFSEKFINERVENAVYKLFPLEKIDQLPVLVKNTSNLKGLNVTIPHKISIIPYLDELDDEARDIGSVNTVKVSINELGKKVLAGYNTDAHGFRESIKPLIKPVHKKALILGTGGAAKAVEYVLRQLRIEISFVSRKTNSLQSSSENPEVKDILPYSALTKDIISMHQMIINTTPAGMYPHTDQCPDIPYQYLTKDHLLYDLVYNPEETMFLKNGKQRGATVKNGLEMLELQAEKAWELWD